MNKIFLLYSCGSGKLIKVSRSKEKVLTKIGADFLAGGIISNYKVIEVDLDEIEEIEE